ncbi:7887_t:CDS:2, partial [Ambispora gerdemannii]
MTEPIMPKVNDKFESLKAFEDAAKANGFAFSRKNSYLTGRKGKSPFVVLQCIKADSNAPTRIITAAVNKIINGGIIHPKDIVNERA